MENRFSTIGEKQLEAKLRREVERLGGLALKYTSQYHAGMPDRIVLMPRGKTYFVELKSPGKRPSLLQQNAMADLADIGFRSFVISSPNGLTEFLKLIKKELDELTAPKFEIHLR